MSNAATLEQETDTMPDLTKTSYGNVHTDESHEASIAAGMGGVGTPSPEASTVVEDEPVTSAGGADDGSVEPPTAPPGTEDEPEE